MQFCELKTQYQRAVDALAPQTWAGSMVEFNSLFSALARKHNAVFYRFFLTSRGEPLLNQQDGIHPNRAGVDEIVQRILPKVSTTSNGSVHNLVLTCNLQRNYTNAELAHAVTADWKTGVDLLAQLGQGPSSVGANLGFLYITEALSDSLDLILHDLQTLGHLPLGWHLARYALIISRIALKFLTTPPS